jgi:hypothetical protein
MSVASEPHPRVGILMGADSDWPVMQVAARSSDELGVPYEARVVSAHRTPELLFDHAERARGRDLAAIVASAGGVVAFPTETVYGLGADAQRGRGAAGVRPQGSARRSPPHRASGRDRPGRCSAAEIPEPARRLMARFWPGPLTLGSAAPAVGLPIS